MKLLRKSSLDYLEKPGYDFWKKTLLLSFLNVLFGTLSTISKVPSSSIIMEAYISQKMCVFDLRVNCAF